MRVWGRRLGFKVRSFRELPIVSIVLPFFGLTKYMIRILEGNTKKELQ